MIAFIYGFFYLFTPVLLSLSIFSGLCHSDALQAKKKTRCINDPMAFNERKIPNEILPFTVAYASFKAIKNKASNKASADIELSFVIGTAFLVYITSKNGLTGEIIQYGAYGVGMNWHENLPGNSIINLCTQTLTGCHNLAFKIVKPVPTRIAFWGIADDPQYSIDGDAVKRVET